MQRGKVTEIFQKSVALLRFLSNFARIRRKRIAHYSDSHKLLWFSDLTGLEPWVRSPIVFDDSRDYSCWLEISKPSLDPPPPLPAALSTDFAAVGLDDPRAEPHLEPRRESQGSSIAYRPLAFEAVLPQWQKYLETAWRPWAEKRLRAERAQEAYECVDFMRRRIEEAEEHYELVLGIGLLAWRDPLGVLVQRHLLTAPAEIVLDPRRGKLTVLPAGSFEVFRVELDMLDPQYQPRLNPESLESLLEELDVRAWDRQAVHAILCEIGNRISSRTVIDAAAFSCPKIEDQTPRIVYAPALILRERRLTAYEDLVGRFLQAAESGEGFRVTAPWVKLVAEGSEASDNLVLAGEGAGVQPQGSVRRLYFPLPTNDEQRRIGESLEKQPCVLVKGPPGTGKSHTIVNLICHLLARGERVLVTAHTAKALEVLLDLTPPEISALCVTLLGSTYEDRKRLEESVRRILHFHDVWPGPDWANREQERLERQLHEYENRAAQLDRQLRELQESEFHTHSVAPGYEGTPAEIARRVRDEQSRYDWFPPFSRLAGPFPLSAEQLEEFVFLHGRFSERKQQELSVDLGPDDLPSPEEISAWLEEIQRNREALGACGKDVARRIESLKSFTDQELAALEAVLINFQNRLGEAVTAVGEPLDGILQDFHEGRLSSWLELAERARSTLARLSDYAGKVGEARVEVPTDVPLAQLLHDAQERLAHLRSGKSRGWWLFAPRAIRVTQYVERHCSINGHAVNDVVQLERLVAYLKFREGLEQFRKLWPWALRVPDESTPSELCKRLAARLDAVKSLLDALSPLETVRWTKLSEWERSQFTDSKSRTSWLQAIGAERARRQVELIQARFESLRQKLEHYIRRRKVHPWVRHLAVAAAQQDWDAWRAAWENLTELKQERQKLERYQRLKRQLEMAHPGLTSWLQQTAGDPTATERVRELDRAWDWATASFWVQSHVKVGQFEQLIEERHSVQKKIEKALADLVAHLAWTAFMRRLDDTTRQSLVAWTKAVARIGKGTGVHAWKHRRSARKYLTQCLHAVPVWVMPLYRVWEMTESLPGVFDTVIVDEASQAGLEALVLLLLAKRIVVVGDDKQNSPEGVGIAEADIERLVREHLGEFKFSSEYRPESSLYDHAERVFGSLISLREHFRCVPEIIRFSNELCYREAPLIPLRQPPPDRLPPLKRVFVDSGRCEGSEQYLINRAEAEAIVHTIEQCLADAAYEGKTMGVIALQGHRQAQLIEQELAWRIPPEVRARRKLRCGVPATFQGDQRDVIFLSLVVAPNHRFRALTEIEAVRRFNVAVSRARDQVWLFHSVQLQDLSKDDLRWRLLHFFYQQERSTHQAVYEQLERLERALRYAHRSAEPPEPYESWFEVDVVVELLRRGYRVIPQYEVAGYRIDLVIDGAASRLAVECDGDRWHGLERFASDVHRQRQLERAGWNFVRIRGSEFYADREQVLQRIAEACSELDIYPDVDDGGELLEQPRPVGAGLDGDEEDDAEDSEELFAEDEEEQERTWFPDPRTSPIFLLQEVLRRLIEQEGPMNKRRLFRSYLRRCPHLQRIGRAARAAIDRGLYLLKRAGEIEIFNWAGLTGPEYQELVIAGRPRVQVRPAGDRDLLEIPPSELVAVLESDVDYNWVGSSSEESLMRLLLNHYGFQRLTSNRRRYLQAVLRAWQKARARSSGRA